ncbi:DUF7553 family protein [Halopiger xanaduensis]|uniref:Uncharacterized protein n=1 Tax=Halopiger xanaduensis (strain DSM 18323 / JCM 14033 / SH-6) TaxID=797210 RepID=F8D6Z2_HALXS|nr:hypothetical protein [Halopiger xanaduensis]AEH35421.1 hypothetical protein Halxa_0782 [Halopiger xanaduensis SH-6]
MNKHFHDSRYYLTRAAEHARLGIAETLAPVTDRIRDRLGRSEPEPEPESELDRLETVREEVASQAREAIGTARERVTAYRGEASATDERKP